MVVVLRRINAAEPPWFRPNDSPRVLAALALHPCVAQDGLHQPSAPTPRVTRRLSIAATRVSASQNGSEGTRGERAIKAVDPDPVAYCALALTATGQDVLQRETVETREQQRRPHLHPLDQGASVRGGWPARRHSEAIEWR